MDQEKLPEETKAPAVSVNIDGLKAKIEELKAKNIELMDKCKLQAAKIKVQAGELSERMANTKAALAGKSLVEKVKGLFKKGSAVVVPKKQIVGVNLVGESLCLYGYVFHSRATGCLVVRDAQLVEYSLGDKSFMFIQDVEGNPSICRENVSFIIDAQK